MICKSLERNRKIERNVEMLEDQFDGVSICENDDGSFYVELEGHTSDGGEQFICFDVDEEEEMEYPWYWGERIEEYFDNFNPVAEAMLWVDEEGNGINGVPGTVIDIHRSLVDWSEDTLQFARSIQ